MMTKKPSRIRMLLLAKNVLAIGIDWIRDSHVRANKAFQDFAVKTRQAIYISIIESQYRQTKSSFSKELIRTMHLTATNLVKGLLGIGSKSKVDDIDQVISPKPDDHVYIRGRIEDRGPCPAFNALANQGYLPRDGKNITLAEVEAVLKTTFHFTPALASSLTRSLKPLIHKDGDSKGTFSLRDMNQHNILEHDRSVTRYDILEDPTHSNDNYTFQPTFFASFLADANGGPVTIKSLAKTYVRRKKESKAAGSPNLPLNLWFVNLLQTVSLMNTAQTGEELQKDLLVEFYTEEKIPEVILRNEKRRTLFGLVSKAAILLFHTVF
ncbi:hypothetical protein VTL71DRAFT_14529 [Oculimacula yallundae]|uniref:Heme haloperoxidase family profile domain-containing protein n=1 Tax=Oculimacula yallundae TaxID=86028 RepID=A0ABR4CJB8_9HELO